MLLIFKYLFKTAYIFLGIVIIYFFFIVYLNTSYNRYLISNYLTKSMPGKFYIEKISIPVTFDKITLRNISVTAPKGEKVINIKKAVINISPLDIIKDLILNNKVTIDSAFINKADLNIIIKKGYLNIAETFFQANRYSEFLNLISSDLYRQGFMFFDDSVFISKSSNKNPMRILINNIKVDNSSLLLNISDNLIFDIADFKIKNASFLTGKNFLIRGDGSLKKGLLRINDKYIMIDKADLYSYEQNSEHIALKKGFLYIKDSQFDTSVNLGTDILSRMDISFNGKIASSIIESIAKENKIKIPQKIKLGRNINLETQIFGTTYYPRINLNLLADKIYFEDFYLERAVIDAYYQSEQSEVNFYLKKLLYKNKEVKRIRANLFTNNKNTVNLDNFSFEADNSNIKLNGKMNFINGKLDNSVLKVKNFNPMYLKSLIKGKIDKKYEKFLNGMLNTNLKLSALNIYEKEKIKVNLNTDYKLKDKGTIGKKLKIKTNLIYDKGKIKIYKNSYIKADNLFLELFGYLNLNKKNLNLKFKLIAKKFEQILKEFNITDFSGNADLKGSVTGYIENPTIKSNIHLSNFNYLHYKNNDISTDIKIENGLFQLYGLTVSNEDFQSFITAKAKLYKKNINNFLKEPQFSLFVNLENAKIGNIIQNSDINMNLDTEIIIYGTPSKLNGTINSYSKDFTINNEPFDDLNLNITIKEDEKTSQNILYIDNLNINKDKKDFLKLTGNLNLNSLKYSLQAYMPRLKIQNLNNIKNKDKKPLFSGDAIASLLFNGDIKNKTFDYDFKMRLASCYYPYELETTVTKTEPSDEFGVADKITFEKVKLNKKLMLGEGLISITGNQEKAEMNGKLFKMISLKSFLENLLTHPVFTMEMKVDDFPADKFYTAPVKSLISLSSFLKYDLLDKKILFGQIVFDDITLNLGDLRIKQSLRKLKSSDKHCIVLKDGEKTKKNCIEYINDKLYVDLGLSFLEEHINMAGIIIPAKQKMNLNIYGGINLKSFSYFKNIFSSVDGNAYIYSNISGTFQKPRYNFNLKIKNASFQPSGYDKDITIDNAQIMMRQNKVYIRNIKGNMLGGDFEITGDPKNNNMIYNLANKNLYINFIANNLEYNLPDVADIETSLNLTLKGNLENLKLYGNTKIIDGKFYKEINIVDNILNPITQKTEVYDEGFNINSVPVLKNISLDINLINEGLTISNNLMADVAVKANLTILGTLGRPIIVGEITAKDGTVNLLRNVFDLTNLAIKFNKTDLMASKLNFEAESIVKDYDPVSDEYTNRNVSLTITGELNNPKVELNGEGLTKVQTLMLLLTGQSGLNTSGTTVNDDRGSKITNQVFSILLQNSLNKLTSDFTKQTDISIQTSINSSGGLSVSANKRIAERVVVSGVGEFENNTLQKEISAEIIITDELVIEILKAFEAGITNLGLKYRLKLK